MLEIYNLNKQYGRFLALDGLNLTIKKGELFGFVGPNGAGKTTTMKIISGLLQADSGQVLVDGIDARTDNKKLKEKIGYMPDFFGVYDNLKAIEYMEFYSSIYGIEGKAAKKRCLHLMELVNLSDKADNYVDGLSRGMKQRLCLARSLIHDPELLILDEPASGLDPRARFEMKEILKRLSNLGKTIIISSHILPELAQTCTAIGIIEKGKMVVHGTVEDILFKLNASNPLVMKFSYNQEMAIKILKENPLVENLTIRDNSAVVTFTGTVNEESELLKKMILSDVLVTSFTREQGSLESLFMSITKEN